MLKRIIRSLFIPALALGFGVQVIAGGVLETTDITGRVPSPLAGQIVARFVGIRWDVRTIPVQYRVNNTFDPIPNPLGPAPGVEGAPILSLAEASAVLQRSLDLWNNIPTSYIDMRIVGTYTPPAVTGLVGFDMVNEITFRTAASFGAIASSPSVSMIQDSELVPGMDLDSDGDSDVAASIRVATDVDADGDIEFPAGQYKAGTILDNDVQFNTKVSNGLRLTIADEDIDAIARSADLMAVAVHEFGHSHGLSHNPNNQTGAGDGTGSTMFPFLDTTDPATELADRALHADDIAWSSYVYPEGTAARGPARARRGDVPFASVYGVIHGAAKHGVLNRPLVGASVSAIDRKTGAVVATALSGTAQASLDPATGILFAIPSNPGFQLINGNYSLPVPRGNYSVGIEPVDGFPVSSGTINFTAQTGTIFALQNFNEEFYSGQGEADLELRSGQAASVPVNAGSLVSGIDITTSRTMNIDQFGSRNGLAFFNAPGGLYYAVRVPAATIAALSPDRDFLVQGIAFDTAVTDASVVPIFAEAMLTTGTVNSDGSVSVDLASPLVSVSDFVAQDNDLAPLHFNNPRQLARRIGRGIGLGEIQNLFIVLRLPPAPFHGSSGQPPLVGVDSIAPIVGHSYTSTDGIRFNPVPVFDLRFSLILAEPPPEPGS